MNRVFTCSVGAQETTSVWRGRLTHFVYIGASVLGGLALGAALVLLQYLSGAVSVSGRPMTVLAIVITSVAVVLELRECRYFAAQPRRQVNQSWIAHRGIRTAVIFGFQLGAGVFTWFFHAAFIALLVGAWSSGSAPLALVVGIAFGPRTGSPDRRVRLGLS